MLRHQSLSYHPHPSHHHAIASAKNVKTCLALGLHWLVSILASYLRPLCMCVCVLLFLISGAEADAGTGQLRGFAVVAVGAKAVCRQSGSSFSSSVAVHDTSSTRRGHARSAHTPAAVCMETCGNPPRARVQPPPISSPRARRPCPPYAGCCCLLVSFDHSPIWGCLI